MFHLGVLTGNKPMSGSFGDLLSPCVCVCTCIYVCSHNHIWLIMLEVILYHLGSNDGIIYKPNLQYWEPGERPVLIHEEVSEYINI